MSYASPSTLGQEPNPTSAPAASSAPPWLVGLIGLGFIVAAGVALSPRRTPVRRNTKRRTSRKKSPGRLLLTRGGDVLEEAPVSESAYRRFKKLVNDTVWEERAKDIRYDVTVEARGQSKSVFSCWWRDLYIGGKSGLHQVGRACSELSPQDRKKYLHQNARGARRTTARKRGKGRPTVKPVAHYEDWVKLPEGYYHVEVHLGKVHIDRHAERRPTSTWVSGVAIGTVYDTGTMFRSVPREWDPPVREFTTMAGAIKYLIRQEFPERKAWAG